MYSAGSELYLTFRYDRTEHIKFDSYRFILTILLYTIYIYNDIPNIHDMNSMKFYSFTNLPSIRRMDTNLYFKFQCDKNLENCIFTGVMNEAFETAI